MIKENIKVNGVYDHRPDREDRRSVLAEEYDREHEDLRDALRDSPSHYEAERDKWIRREMEMDQEYEEANSVLENRTEDYFRALTEETTGLKRREALFRDMDREIARAFGLDNVKEMDDAELLRIVKQYSPEDFKDLKLNAMMGDMAYLSLANEGGHREGDELLGNTGRVLLQELHNASRHGGDEFTALLKLDGKDARTRVEALEERISNGEDTPTLKKYGLRPQLDIGLSHFSEGLKVFQAVVREMERTPEGQKKIASLNVLKELEDTWLEIADKRSAIKKARERIVQLVNMKGDEHNPDLYRKVIDFLRKGAYGIKDAELDDLAAGIKAGQPADKAIEDFIVAKEQALLEKQEGHKRKRLEVILRIIN